MIMFRKQTIALEITVIVQVSTYSCLIVPKSSRVLVYNSLFLEQINKRTAGFHRDLAKELQTIICSRLIFLILLSKIDKPAVWRVGPFLGPEIFWASS